MLSMPLIPLPAEDSTDVDSRCEPTPGVVPPSVAFSREGPFDAATETVATGDQLYGCTYRITMSQDWDMACIDSLFGV